jgi:hypothetical protein
MLPSNCLEAKVPDKSIIFRLKTVNCDAVVIFCGTQALKQEIRVISYLSQLP